MQLIMLGIACLILSVLSASLKAKNKNKVTKRNVEIHTIGDSKSAVQEMLRNAGFDEETVNMVGNKSVVRGSKIVTKRTVIKDGVTISEEVHTTSNGGTDQGITEFTSQIGSNFASEELDREFCDKAVKDIETYLSAYNNSNIELLNKSFSKEVREKLESKLTNYNKKNIRKSIDNFDVRNSYIDDKSKHEGYKYRVVIINGVATEYETDIHSGRVIVGDKELKVGIQYKMTYKSKIGVGDEIKEGVCKECGAPIQAEEQTCKYCGSGITGVDGPFIVTRVEKTYISYS